MTHRADQRDVVEALAVVRDVADEAGRVPIDAGDGREPADQRHRPDEEERDHRVREREHEEVDAEASRRDGAEHEPDPDRQEDRGDERDRRIPAEQEALRLPAGLALRDHVRQRIPGDAHQARLRERDHAAVGRQEDQARGADPEDQRLREDGVQPVVAEEHRRDEREHERDDADRPLGHRLGRVDRHAALPNSPCGRNASTSAIRANVSTTEYCVQQLLPVVGRYDDGEREHEAVEHRSDRGAGERPHAPDDHDDEREEQPLAVTTLVRSSPASRRRRLRRRRARSRRGTRSRTSSGC